MFAIGFQFVPFGSSLVGLITGTVLHITVGSGGSAANYDHTYAVHVLIPGMAAHGDGRQIGIS